MTEMFLVMLIVWLITWITAAVFAEFKWHKELISLQKKEIEILLSMLEMHGTLDEISKKVVNDDLRPVNPKI